MQLTDEHIRMLAKSERDMDSGAQPYVHLEGSASRMALDASDMERYGLVQGQNITWAIFSALCRARIESLENEIAYAEFLKAEGLSGISEVSS